MTSKNQQISLNRPKKNIQVFKTFIINDNNKEAYNKSFNFYNSEKGIYLYGLTGCGKTHLLKATYQTRNNRALYIPLCELLLDLRESFKENAKLTERDIIDDISEYQYLFIDDLGSEKITDFSRESLYIIIDRRLRSNMKKVFITGNLNMQQLSEKVGDRIASRICELCDIVQINDKDHRLNKI